MRAYLSRRTFAMGLFVLGAYCLAGCDTVVTPAGEAQLPDVVELLALDGSDLLDWLLTNGYSYDEVTMGFSAPGSYAGRTGTIVITVLGEETASHGRRMPPEQLANNDFVHAVTATLLFGDVLDSRHNADPQAVIDQELDRSGLDPRDLIGVSIGQEDAEAEHPSFAGAACNVSNKQALWGCTFLDEHGITVSCSYLDYYAQSMHVPEDYDIIAHVWGPWDISISNRIDTL